MATLEELSAALVKADAAGNAADAQAFADAIRQMRSGVPGPRKTGADLIPTEPGANLAPTVTPKQSAMDIARGVIETPAAIAATMLGGPITYLSGVAGPEVQRKVAANIQYQPRTQMAQDVLESIARNPVVEKLPPFMPAMGVARTAGPAARTVGGAVRSEADLIRESVQAPFAARAERTQQQRVRESEINAPRIDAAKDALELGIALDPAVSNPTKSNMFKSRVVGTGNLDTKLAEQNLPQYTAAAKKDLGLPATVKLDAKAFEQARNAPELSKPYDAVRSMPQLVPDADTFAKLDSLQMTPLVGDTGQAAAANTFLGQVKQQLSAGVDGATLVDSIRQRRREAQAIYNQQSKGINPPSPEALAKADMNIGVANALEGMIESNITNNPTLLGDFRKARAAMAKTYDYERATNFATGNIDPQVIAKMAEEGKPMSGILAKIGNVAANFPEVSRADISKKATWGEKLTRSSPGGTVGAIVGAPFGLMGSIVGGAGGAAIGNVLTAAEARRMATPSYQAKNAIPKDYRPPVNNLRPAEINYGPNQVVPFDPAQSVVMPGQMPYQPNFTMQGQGQGPGRVVYDPVTKTFRGELSPAPFMPSEAPRNMLGYSPEVPVQGQPGAFDIMRARERDLSMRLGRQAEAQQAAAEAAVPRKPAAGEVILDFDPITGRFREASQGIKGATPETFQKLSALDDAAKKVTEGKLFDLTATEKVAWDKAKVDFAEVAPGFKSLTDKAIAQKMMDRKWIEETVAKAREKAAMFDDISRRVAGEQAKRDAAIKRDQMLDVLAALEERLSAPRPVSSGIQGPKTRAAKRNALAPDNQNNLAP
jgi:hypothetical protein